MDTLRNQQFERTENPEVVRVRGQQPPHACPRVGGGQVRIQNAPAAEPRAGHPLQKRSHGLVAGEDVNRFCRVPPALSFLQSFRQGQGLAKPTRIGDDVKELRQDLRSNGQRRLCLKDLRLQQRVRPGLNGGVGIDPLDQKRRVRPNRSFGSLPSSISASTWSLASGCGRRRPPSERPFMSRSDGPRPAEQRRATGWSRSVMITSPEVGRFDTTSSRRCLASLKVTWLTERICRLWLGATRRVFAFLA